MDTKGILLVLALCLPAGPTGAARPTSRAPSAPSAPSTPSPSPSPMPQLHQLPDPALGGRTDCGACHNETGWSRVRFDHSRTGFVLEGVHAQTSCRNCHQRDFRTHIADTCAGCHRDRHAGSLGLHCEGCHTDADWRAVAFWSDGHQNTRFPLLGKHGAIPCQECHGNMRDRTFSPTPVACVSCHRADFNGAALRSIDHVAAAFGTECQSCHTTDSFFPARFDAHDACFVVSKGSHRGLQCAQCHPTVVGLRLTGTCTAPTTTCTTCHTHECARTDRQHPNVMGYLCADAKCYQCHQPIR